MSETIDIAKIFQESPDLFPWVVLVIILAVCYKERELIKELFTSIIKSRQEMSVYHAQHNELVRNNTSALNNNTAALKMVENEHGRIALMIENHEKNSIERASHIQTVVNRIDEIVNVNTENIKIVEDRTRK